MTLALFCGIGGGGFLDRLGGGGGGGARLDDAAAELATEVAGLLARSPYEASGDESSAKTSCSCWWRRFMRAVLTMSESLGTLARGTENAGDTSLRELETS